MRFLTSRVLLLSVVILSVSVNSFAQDKLSILTRDNADLDVSNNKLRLEFEPGLFFNNGRSLSCFYTVTEDNNFAVGLYLMATDIPEEISKNLFNNIQPNTNIRVTQEYAFNFRYRLNVFKKYESNPYVGLILGWEELRFRTLFLPDFTITTFLVTPHLGYEAYLYKKMFYINPQIRSVFYVGDQKSDDSRLEELKGFTVLPSISIGLRI